MAWWKRKKEAQPVSPRGQGWVTISEPFAGAWQRNKELRTEKACYPTLYACLNRISSDIAKLPFVTAVWNQGVQEYSAPMAVLKKPNNYQTQGQFREAWVLSKLRTGATYVLKNRTAGEITSLHVLDPYRVTPMVTEAGAVFYRLDYPTKNNLLPEEYPDERLILPASEIIHDRMHCLYNPLIGISPLCASELAAGKNLKILRSSSEFFSNGAQPGGLLTAPAGISEEDASKIKDYWDNHFADGSRGKMAVIGADMKYTAFAFKAADSQLVEQMRYSDEQICQPFGIPPFKVGIGVIPAGMKVDDINQLYYSDALQQHIEAMETLLIEGLEITDGRQVKLNLEPLLRMDVGKQAEVESTLVSAMIKTPDEARHRFNLKPTGGGDTLWGQLQQYPLGQLANRNDLQQDETEQAINALNGEPANV